MSNVKGKIFNHTHYGVSTAAAVLYAVVWLFGTRVNAEAPVESTLLPAVVVTAQRMVETVLEPIIVTAQRPQVTVLEPVLVLAKREAVGDDSMQRSAAVGSRPAVDAGGVEYSSPRKRLIARLRTWLSGSLIK